MDIYDPTQSKYVPLVECERLPGNGVEQACRHMDGAWFILRTASGTGVTLEHNPEVAKEVAAHEAVASRIVESSDYESLVESYGEDAADEAMIVAPSSLVASFLNESVDDPHSLKAVFVVGSSGSGKSAAVNTMFAGSDYKIIDQDKHLMRMLQDAELAPSQIGELGWAAVQDAKRKSEIERDHYAKMRLGLVIDGTGWSYDRIAGPVRMLRRLGYDCYMVHVDVSLDKALSRNKARGDEGGRFVPPMYVRDAHGGLNANVKAYKRLFGESSYFHVSNERDLSPDVWSKTVGSELRKIANQIGRKPVKNQIGVEWMHAGGKSKVNKKK